MRVEDLTELEIKWIEAYVAAGLDPTQATIAVLPDCADPEAEGRKFLAKRAVKAELRRRRDELEERARVSQERAVDELLNILYANIGDFVEWSEYGVRIREKSEVSPELMRAVQEIRETKQGLIIRMHSKVQAYHELALTFGWYKQNPQAGGSSRVVIKLPEKDLRGAADDSRRSTN